VKGHQALPLLTFCHHLSLGARLAVSHMAKHVEWADIGKYACHHGGPQQYGRDAKTFMNALVAKFFNLNDHHTKTIFIYSSAHP